MGDERLFVVERGGLVKIVDASGTVASAPYLDITGRISQDGGERGLLGLAFHPEYSSNGYFYVDYVDPSGNSQISRFKRSSVDPDLADPNSELKMLTITQPSSNHNGGCIAFGPDGFLYIGMGDGGGGDQDNNAQNTSNLLGTILRIDVNQGEPYAIPADNPFVGNSNARDEIWAYGLRNPWKFSFDTQNGSLWIADVGQEQNEEINKVNAAQAGLNYGWRCYEGNANYNTAGCADAGSFTFPFSTYGHDSNRCSITGGYVYHGSRFSELQNKYIFADYCSNELAFIASSGDADGPITYSAPFDGAGFSSFGLDSAGELYVSSIGRGKIYKVVDAEALSVSDIHKNKFKLYPNPAQDRLKFSIDPSIRKPSIVIFDLLGKTVLSQKNILNTTQLNIAPLKAGIYLVQFSNASTILKTEKLIVH